MGEAVKTLGAAEAGAKKQVKISKSGKQTGRFPAGLEWEVVSADAIILNGATNVLRYAHSIPSRCTANLLPNSETYMGYLQCL
jgi:hypothetical protein